MEYGYVLDMIAHELKAQSQLLVLLGGDSGNFQVTYLEGVSHHVCVTGLWVLSQPLCVARLSYLCALSCSTVLHPPHHDGQKP